MFAGHLRLRNEKSFETSKVLSAVLTADSSGENPYEKLKYIKNDMQRMAEQGLALSALE